MRTLKHIRETLAFARELGVADARVAESTRALSARRSPARPSGTPSRPRRATAGEASATWRRTCAERVDRRTQRSMRTLIPENVALVGGVHARRNRLATLHAIHTSPWTGRAVGAHRPRHPPSPSTRPPCGR
jgi:hypothetical protein